MGRWGNRTSVWDHSSHRIVSNVNLRAVWIDRLNRLTPAVIDDRGNQRFVRASVVVSGAGTGAKAPDRSRC